MRHHSSGIIGLAAVALVLVTGVASAQATGHGKDKQDKQDKHRVAANGDVYDNHGNKVPPGLAKKPGQMPPGQYKKYGTNQGASVLGDIMRQRGYSVVRVVPAGNSQYVYYRYRNGAQQRAIVSPGTDRLGFTNVPQSLLQEVLARLY